MMNNDDDAKIMAEHNLMEHIKKCTPEYDYVTRNMTEDQRIIYENSLKNEYLNRNKR